MLGKIENVYLSILRVVILVSATIALIVAAFGLVSAVPSMLRWAGVTQPEKPLGGSLREFIEEQRITDTQVDEDDPTTQEYVISPEIQEASALIHTYLKGQISEKQWRIGLQTQADEFLGESDAYAESVLRLAKELGASKGKPLTEAQVVQLVDWNTERFRADLETKRAAEAQEGAEFWVKLAAAGMGFLAFVTIIFIFLFVKIERNLRPVPGQTEPDGVDYA